MSVTAGQRVEMFPTQRRWKITAILSGDVQKWPKMMLDYSLFKKKIKEEDEKNHITGQTKAGRHLTTAGAHLGGYMAYMLKKITHCSKTFLSFENKAGLEEDQTLHTSTC